MQSGKVIPLLFGLDVRDITGPLAQFQAKKVDQTGLVEVMQAIGNVSENKNQEDVIRRRSNGLLSEFKEMIEKLPDRAPMKKHMTKKHIRSETEILEDLLTGVRGLDLRLNEFNSEIMAREPQHYRRFRPRVFQQIIRRFNYDESDPIFLLMLGGMFREDMPWMVEVFVETYREIRTGGIERIEQSVRRLQRIVRSIRKTPLLEILTMEEDDEAHTMMMDLSTYTDRILSMYMAHHSLPENEKDRTAGAPPVGEPRSQQRRPRRGSRHL